MEIDDEDCKSSINTAVSEPIEIKVTSTNLDDESSKVRGEILLSWFAFLFLRIAWGLTNQEVKD